MSHDKAASNIYCNNRSKFLNKTLQDYEVISVIGSGSFGTCYKVRDKSSGDLFVWKGVDYDELSESKKESLLSEINVLSQLQHPNIVQYYHHLVSHEAKSVFIIMECCEGGDLAQLITRARAKGERFEEMYIWRVLFQICKAVQVCHNKIKRGTILHRDIKPANIFLDSDGNAKLGDFGLARMLRRFESFAETFVGTPYYMSPEIIKGTKYDRKSDVWSVGCLIYEMCALRPPFKGRHIDQLTVNISNGKFTSIPDVYSSDLQEIITFMLEVENDQRPCIEVITRHPVVVRNINNMSSGFPKLIPYRKNADSEMARTKLEFNNGPELFNTMLTEQNSFHEEYGQRRLSLGDIFTHDLQIDTHYSSDKVPFTKTVLQHSDPQLYDSIRRDHEMGDDVKRRLPLSQLLTDITCRTTQERLHTVRSLEIFLKKRELELDKREQTLNEREMHLQHREATLHNKLLSLKAKERNTSLEQSSKVTNERHRMPLPEELKPSQQGQSSSTSVLKPAKLDDTYCTSELNDTAIRQPTVAKLNFTALPPVKAFPTLRKITFQSPKKFIRYEIENVSPSKRTTTTNIGCKTSTMTGSLQMRASITSKGSNASTESRNHRRKSILSIFNLNRSSKDFTRGTVKTNEKPIASSKSENIVSTCNTTELTNIWTKEQKQAAFSLLATMNASAKSQPPNATQCLRQSVRHHTWLQRDKNRRSIATVPQSTSSWGEHIII